MFDDFSAPLPDVLGSDKPVSTREIRIFETKAAPQQYDGQTRIYNINGNAIDLTKEQMVPLKILSSRETLDLQGSLEQRRKLFMKIATTVPYSDK